MTKRTQQPQGSQRTFLRKITLLGFGLFLVNIFMYLFFAYPVFYKYYRIPVKSLTHYRTFILGDSHARVLAQQYLDNYGIYNFSYGSDSYVDMLAKLDYIFRNKIKIDSIFITADDHTLSAYREAYNNNSRSIIYTDRELYRQYYRNWGLSYTFDKHLRHYFPLIEVGNARLFLHYLASRLQSDNDITDNLTVNWADNPNKTAVCQERKNNQFQGTETSPILTDALCHIIELCQKHNTALIGIKFPLSRQYSECLGSMNTGADSLLLHHNIAVLDFKNIFKDHDEYFFDQDHLNDTGVLKFLRLLPDKIASVQRKNWSNGVWE